MSNDNKPAPKESPWRRYPHVPRRANYQRCAEFRRRDRERQAGTLLESRERRTPENGDETDPRAAGSDQGDPCR